MRKNNKVYIIFVLLVLLAGCNTDPLPPSDFAGGDGDAGEVVEIVIGDYPAWAGQAPEPGTRTTIDPDNNLKTSWKEGDKVWIAITRYGIDFITSGHATYNGLTWDTELRWPVGVAEAWFYAHYLGDHEPNGAAFWNTDILVASTDYISAGNPVILNNFYHRTNRITLTGQSLDGLYLSGDGFRKLGVNASDYYTTPAPLSGSEVSLSGTSTTVYLYFVNGSRQLYKKGTGGSDDELIGELSFTYNAIDGYAFEINIDGILGGGGTNPNEEQEKAREKMRFLAWADDYRNDIKRESFTLQTDIDLTGVNWEPINFVSGHTFDGGEHIISGITAGLFGAIIGNSTVKNLHVTGSVTGSDFVGGIVGVIVESTLNNVSFTGTVSGSGFVGGIASRAIGSTFTNCRYYANPPDDLKFLGVDFGGGTTIKDCSPW